MIRLVQFACHTLFVVGAIGNACIAAADVPRRFISSHCVDCHSGDTAESGIKLDQLERYSQTNILPHEDSVLWQRVLKAIDEGEMPPKNADQPSQRARALAVRKLDRFLQQVSPIGGTLLRRLSRREYQASIEKVFGFDFELANSFPEDRINQGFDNSAGGLVLSAPLMEAYFHSAIEVADILLPPLAKPAESKVTQVPAEELVISYSSGQVIEGAMRLAFNWDVMFRSTTWPEKWEAKHAGNYRIKVSASQLLSHNAAYPSFDGPMQMQVRARSLDTPDSEAVTKQRLLGTFEVQPGRVEVFECTAELYPNETPIFYFANGPVPGDKEPLAELSSEMFHRDLRLYAGWNQMPQTSGGRGGLGWERVKQVRDSLDLDLDQIDTSDEAIAKLAKSLSSNPGNFGETMVFQFYEEGPALQLHHVTIEGPLNLVQTPEQTAQAVRSQEFFGDLGERSTEEYLNWFYAKYLSALFRRPASGEEVGYYVALTLAEEQRVGELRKGLHLGIRTSLMSPYFLYRGHHDGLMDGYDLATRLSFFLTGEPPDEELTRMAAEGWLLEADVLKYQAARLIDLPRSANFVASFVSQWLEIDQLEDIMPDGLLISNFTDDDRQSMVRESELFFAEILSKNLPLETFIEPDFTFVNAALARKIYGIEGVKGDALKKTMLPEDSPYGGLLGQASVMMATANGVDTLPVTRGVWVLENILGDPPPAPPENVPALTPDTGNAKTVRELLAAHRADDACASCHRSIDPIGFVLENFDPVGRWRNNYPVLAEHAKGNIVVKEGAAINASGTYKDGAQFEDVHTLRHYIVANIDSFSMCLAQKLLQYATGRPVSYAERLELQRTISQWSQQTHAGFRDLLLAIIQTESFRTK